ALGACDIGATKPRALVYAGLMTIRDARSRYMISGMLSHGRIALEDDDDDDDDDDVLGVLSLD
nr:hypothetical protein [Tanacetum cinerariifolium]